MPCIQPVWRKISGFQFSLKGQLGPLEGEKQRSALCTVRPLSWSYWLVTDRHGLSHESFQTQSQSWSIENLTCAQEGLPWIWAVIAPWFGLSDIFWTFGVCWPKIAWEEENPLLCLRWREAAGFEALTPLLNIIACLRLSLGSECLPRNLISFKRKSEELSVPRATQCPGSHT